MENMKEIGFLTYKYKKPATWVGGGAFTNTTRGKWVLDGRDKSLKKCLFVRTSGDRASREDQAIVRIHSGDYICEYYGSRWEVGNPEISKPECKRIVKMTVKDDKVYSELEPVDLTWDDMPKEVIEGLGIYHNRSGKFFCKEEGGD